MLIVNVVNNLIIVLFQKKHNFLKGILLPVKKENDFTILSVKINV